MRPALALLLPTLCLALACGENDPVDLPGSDAGGGDAGSDAGDDAGSTDAAPADLGTPDAGGMDATPMDIGTSTTGPIMANPMTWTYVPVPASRCINNTPTGFGVSLNPTSNKVLIFLMGGNACFNVASCFVTANLDGYGPNKFTSDRNGILRRSTFDRTAAMNYFADWNHVFIPYCSGDVFSGTIGTTTIEGASYTFRGYDNMRLFLERIVATFPNATDVLLTGVSAGGFGALINYDQVATAFGSSVRVTLIDDSGPPMADAYVAPCLQDHFRTVWDMDDGPLAPCTECNATSNGAFQMEYMRYLLNKYPARRFGVISSAQDETIRSFWGFGLANCRDLLPGTVLPSYSGAMYQMGLENLRDVQTAPFSNAKLYMPPGTRHVWLGDPPWTTTHYTVVLQDWMIGAIEGTDPWNNVP